MHRWTEDEERLSEAIFAYSIERLRLDPVPLDGPKPPEELERLVGRTITPGGIGGLEALRIFGDVLAPACSSIDHPRSLSFIPCAPTQAAKLFDLVVGASSIYAGSWLEGAGAVFAENQALRWVADLAGFPAGAGGVFVQGGTLGNLSGLVAARYRARRAAERGDGPALRPGRRLAVATSPEAHSSVRSVSDVMDVEVLEVEVGPDRRLSGPALADALERCERQGDLDVFAVVASAGTTNLGIIDDIASLADVAEDRGLWLHVDGAYGLAALAAPSARHRFAGIERADSFVVDPHKWLFSPFDCAALVYRDPEIARAAHAQHAGYLEPIGALGQWDPSDYAVHLSRRARGLPFWFSLATYGTDAYAQAVERTLVVARYAADQVLARDELELLREPELSVVCFRRLGWGREEYYGWSDRLRTAGVALVTPTTVDGEVVARFAIINPTTSEADIELILDSMR